MEEFIEIGQIVNTFGVKGELKINPFTDDITRFDDLDSIYVLNKNSKVEYKIEQVKYHKNIVIIKLKNIDTIEQAEILKGCYININKKDAIKLEEDTYFISDLIGAKVYTDSDELLGVIDDIYNTGSNDIYVVKNENGKQTLIPAISDVVKKVDVSNKKIIVHIIEGLI